MITDYKQAVLDLKEKCREYINFINIDKIKSDINLLEKDSEKEEILE